MKRHLAEIIAECEMPNAVTVDAVMAMRPCYARERVVQLFAGRESLTPDDIVGLPIPAQDRLWVLLRMAQREVWLPAIWACADRAIRHASRTLYRHGRVTEAARLDSVPPIADRASAKVAADATADAADAAYAAHAIADAVAVLAELEQSVAYWSEYAVPVGIIARIDAAKARLAGALAEADALHPKAPVDADLGAAIKRATIARLRSIAALSTPPPAPKRRRHR